MDMDVRLIGQRIRTARKLRGLTLEQVAEHLGFATESVAHIESGASKPSLQTFLKLADYFDVSTDFLAGKMPTPTETLLSDITAQSELSSSQQKILVDMTEALIPIVKRIDK